MSVVVQKYGGSSVATPEKLKEVARRIIATKDAGHSVVVVVSAMADTTDELLTLATQISSSPERRELDMLLTTGERISMALLSMAIRDLGGHAISFTGSQAGIITNHRHVDARIIEVRPVRVQDELEAGNIVIVAGYQGMSYKREITTLGRGGSDTTAVALAAALGAEWCEICSDVDGVYTTDPRIAPSAVRIPEMSYDETREMAENGAKVLNARAVQFAEEKGIAIYARATMGPLPGADPTVDGTVVRKCPPREPGSACGIASQKNIVTITGTTLDPAPCLSILSGLGIAPLRSRIDRDPATGSYQVSLQISAENCHQLPELTRQLGAEFQIRTDLGTVSVIGTGISEDPDSINKGCTVLPPDQIISISTSPHRITWVLPTEHIETATRQLHEVFIEKVYPVQ